MGDKDFRGCRRKQRGSCISAVLIPVRNIQQRKQHGRAGSRLFRVEISLPQDTLSDGFAHRTYGQDPGVRR